MFQPSRKLLDIFSKIALQCTNIDEKDIIDSTLRFSEGNIIEKYELESNSPDFCILRFFKDNFDLPRLPESNFSPCPDWSPELHIESLWTHLRRPADDQTESSLITLPNPYIVPGGRFREAYYWDSYFSILGLLEIKKYTWVREILNNFSHLIESFGHIPNGNRSYYISRSQPPFFAHMVVAFADSQFDNRESILRDYQPALVKEYEFWSKPERQFNSLTRYIGTENTPRQEMYATDMIWHTKAANNENFYRHIRAACESGWDFSSRWLTDLDNIGTIETSNFLPIDLNSLLCFYEETLFELTKEDKYLHAFEARKAAIRNFLFQKDSGFHDYNFKENYLNTKIHSAATLFPLFVNIATEFEAKTVSEQVENHLLQRGGIAATNIHSGEQWDAPNGWAPLQWIAVVGLKNYGFDHLAEVIALRWLATCEETFLEKRKFVEKYNVYDPSVPATGGEYSNQDGFGWTIGVYQALKEMYSH